MTLIDGDKFLAYLIFSKHIDGLSCGEVKEAIEMCKVDILDKIRAEIAGIADSDGCGDYLLGFNFGLMRAVQIIDKYRLESEG